MNRAIAVLAAIVLSGCAASDIDSTVHCISPPVGKLIVAPTLKVLSLNVGHGRNTSWNQVFVTRERTYENLDQIATMIRDADADIVALQEADGESRWSGNFDHVDYVRQRAGFPCSVLGRHADTWLFSYGAALMTRQPFADPESIRFPATPPTATKGFVKARVHWRVGDGVTKVTVVSVHLDFSRQGVRDEQVSLMIEDLASLDTPLIIMGDLNSRWVDERSHVRQLADGLELDAWLPEESGLGTYKSGDGKRLDWILISRDLEFVEYHTLTDVVSDHYPVFAEISTRKEQR